MVAKQTGRNPYEKKGKGEKTRTFRLNGNTYQERILKCGNPKCKRCREGGGGHVTYYRYVPNWKELGRTHAFVSVPSSEITADPDHSPQVCLRDGCDNTVDRGGKKFCSTRCRVAYHRAQNQ